MKPQWLVDKCLFRMSVDGNKIFKGEQLFHCNAFFPIFNAHAFHSLPTLPEKGNFGMWANFVIRLFLLKMAPCSVLILEELALCLSELAKRTCNFHTLPLRYRTNNEK